MRNQRIIPKIGNWASIIGLLATCAWGISAQADEVDFSAQLDRDQISLDESVSVRFSVEAEGSVRLGAVQFQAPDFEVINEYNSVYTKSIYENGKFETRNSQQVTKVLRPLKVGTLMISKLQVQANGKAYSAPDLRVNVRPAGSGAPPPQGYGGGGVGLRGSAKAPSGASAFVRVEVNKEKLFKGEQVIATYYLYARVNILQIQADKFPEMKGFLREELDLPIASQRREREQVVVDGVHYVRMPLARYAAYPLEEGKLKLDPLVVRYQFMGRDSISPGDDDDLLQNFFQQMAPRVSTARSETLTLDVSPLPEAGRPASFTGGVGNFTVNAAVDKYQIHANEAVTLTLKVEGRGNLSSINGPKAKWPDGVELYDSKGRSNSGAGGVGEKIFEYLLIPRTPGKLTLPALEMSFFDPEKKAYVTQSTTPIPIEVLEALPGSESSTPARSEPRVVSTSASSSTAPSATDDLRALKPMPAESEQRDGWLSKLPFWRAMYWLCSLGMLAFFGLVLGDALAKRGLIKFSLFNKSQTLGSKAKSKSWKKLQEFVKKADQGAAWSEVTLAYEELAGLVFDALDQRYDLGARSYSRAELKERLVTERDFPTEEWERISRLLEFAEMVRFASSAGVVSEAKARKELANWVAEGERMVEVLETVSGSG